jgi:hypothetical protein
MAHIRKKTFDLPNFGPGLVAHRLVMETACGMAEALFEVYARDNATYKALRANGQLTTKQARLVFLERVAPRLLEDARKSLTDCLSLPDDVMPVAQKDEIAEALIADTVLRAHRFVAEDQATVPTVLH